MKAYKSITGRKATLYFYRISIGFLSLTLILRLVHGPFYNSFVIDEPTIKHEFILDTPWFNSGGSSAIEYEIEGNLGCNALIKFEKIKLSESDIKYGYKPIYELPIKNGKVTIKQRCDYYDGNKVKLIFKPSSNRKGHLRVKARIV